MSLLRTIKNLIAEFFRLIADKHEVYRNGNIVPTPNQEILSGWSIVVITNGKDKNSLYALIGSIQNELQKTPHEIIIVGPPRLFLSKNIPTIRHIIYHEIKIPLVSGWITRKKNIGGKASRYDKVVVCHDYIVFKEGWKKGFDAFGPFDVASNIFLNKNGTRHKDWITLDYPGVGRGLLPYYAECTKYQYLNGAYFVVRRDFFLENPLDEHLRWGEAEDIEWSKRIREKTTFRFNENSVIIYSKQKPDNSPEWEKGTEKLESIFGNPAHE